MEYLVNDLSFHGQFSDIAAFKAAIARMLTMRSLARRYGREVHVHRNLKNAMVTEALALPQAVGALSLEERRSLLLWVSQYGPFWEDARAHGPDEYLQCGDTLVTDSAVGEAGFCRLNGIDRALLSLTPSDWTKTPIAVEWYANAGDPQPVEVPNFWESAALEAALRAAPPPLTSWRQLESAVRARCTNLTFADDAFAPAAGHPFLPSVSARVLFILDTLHELRSCFDAEGKRTPRGQEIYDNFCTGKKGDGGRGAMIKDSSDTEKAKWENELTFRHPGDSSKVLFCPWHAAIQTPQWRVHFSWPVRADQPLYVVYVGPKITV